MEIEIIDLTPYEIAAVVATEENHFSDVKAIEIAPAKLSRTMSAFANADAGELFVGIDEDRVAGTRDWRGFDSVEAAMDTYRRSRPPSRLSSSATTSSCAIRPAPRLG